MHQNAFSTSERLLCAPEVITEQECRSGVLPEFAFLRWSRSRSPRFMFYHEQEPDLEATLKFVQEPIKNFKRSY